MTDLIGAWSLISSILYRDDVAKPTYGDPPSGQIQYTADGRMSAFLMNPDWPASGRDASDGFNDFFSYAGRWSRDGDQVRHVIEFSSSPARVGTEFVRTVNVIDKNTIELTTAPEVSKSGAVYVTKLVWTRHAAA